MRQYHLAKVSLLMLALAAGGLGCAALPIGLALNGGPQYSHGLAADGRAAVTILDATGEVHVSGSKGIVAGVNGAIASTLHGPTVHATGAILGGYALLPPVDERSRWGYSFVSRLGYGGIAARNSIDYGPLLGLRSELVYRLSPQRTPWEAVADDAPTFYLVPLVDVAGYAFYRNDSYAGRIALSGGIALRVFFWSRDEP